MMFVFVLLILYRFLNGAAALAQTFFSLAKIRLELFKRREGRFELTDSPKIQPVSIIVCSQDQGYELVELIKLLMSLNYPDYEVIVVDDGLTDTTCDVLALEYGLEPINRVFRRSLDAGPITRMLSSRKYPILTVVGKEHSGRADSLNIGVNLARAPLVCILESNRIPSLNALELMAKPFIEEPVDALLSAASSEAEVFEAGTSDFGESLELVERKRQFHSGLMERETFCVIGARENAARMMRKTDLAAVGGFKEATVESDLDMSLRLQRDRIKHGRPYRIKFIPEVFCWEKLNGDPPSKSKQLRAWQAAALRAALTHIGMLYSPRLWRAYLLLVFGLLGPPIEIFALVAVPAAYLLGAISAEALMLYFYVSIVFGLLESIGGIIADEFSKRRRHSLPEILILVLASFADGVFYRYAGAFWRTVGIFEGMIKK